MNGKTIASLFCIASLGVLTAGKQAPMSQGAPASSTGAPQEETCATSGCHDDNAVNSGTARLLLSVEGANGRYIPGHTYDVKVSIEDAGKVRFGFAGVALAEATVKNTGTFSVIDETRTQILSNDVTLEDRRYVTYTYDGTLAKEKGKGEWSFKWTAPTSDVGEIGLYVAANSANDDYTDKGDFIYTTALKLQADTVTAIAKEASPLKPKVRLADNGSAVEIMGLAPGIPVQATIHDLQGRASHSLWQGKSAERQQLTLPTLPNGVYLLRLQAGNSFSTHKILIQR